MRSGRGSAGLGSLAALRRATAERLRDRREEIHEAVIHRTLSVAPPSGHEAPGYVEALRGAIPAAIEHAFDAIEVGEERVGPTPAPIFVQAAASARNEVGLEVVMRRYAAGYSTISDFLHEEIRAVGGTSVHGYTIMQRDLTALFDRLVAEVSSAHTREAARTLSSPRQRRLERVRRLLAGELIDPGGLEYPLEGFHLAVIVGGADPEAAASRIARLLDRRLLVGDGSVGHCAVWLGGARPFEGEELESIAERLDGRLRLAIGEPGEGLAGWRRTRRQAEAAWLVAERSSAEVVRYRDVALVAAALRDPDLAHFLLEAYVEPLSEERPLLLESVRAFLEHGNNASSAAAALGLARQTVGIHLQVAEERLGCRIEECAAHLQTALRLAELDGRAA